MPSSRNRPKTHDEAFLADIVENPDDDTPRLIYADWVEEHGSPERAEFIRAQIELAQPPPPRSRMRRRKLQKRVEELWTAHGSKWSKSLGVETQRLSNWERGFCARYYVSNFETLEEQLTDKVKELPIQYIHISNSRKDHLAKLVTLPLLSQMKGITLFCSSFDDEEKISNDDITLLVQCPYLSRLEKLDLTQHHVGIEGLRMLGHAENMPRLCDLELYNNDWSDEGLLALARSPIASRLRKLHASDVTARGVRDFTKIPALTNLRILNFDNAGVGDAGAKAIAKSPHLSGLTELWLHMCEIRDPGIKALANSPYLANLEVLDITSNWTVGHSAAVALVNSPYLKHIRTLDMWRCEGLSHADEQMLRKRFRSRVNFARSY